MGGAANKDANFGFCHGDIDMIALCFCFSGGAHKILYVSTTFRVNLKGGSCIPLHVLECRKQFCPCCSKPTRTRISSSRLVSSFSLAVPTSSSISTVKSFLLTSCRLIRRNAISLRGGRVLVAKSLRRIAIYAAAT